MLPEVEIQNNINKINDQGRPATSAIFTKSKVTATPEKGRVYDTRNDLV